MFDLTAALVRDVIPLVRRRTQGASKLLKLALVAVLQSTAARCRKTQKFVVFRLNWHV